MVEAKTNNDRRIRLAIIVLMFFGMGGWFGYDGWVKYPSANLKWALENFPVKPDPPRTNPRVTKARVATIEPGMAVADVVAELGEPLINLPRELKFVGEELEIIVHIEEGKVKDVSSRKVEGQDRISADPRVRESVLEEITEGMTVEGLERRLGEAYHDEPPTLWYAGPAVFLKVPVYDGKVAEGVMFHENDERTEGDIQLQKIIAMGLFAIAVWFLIKTAREYLLRITADETGLRLGGRRLAWDHVTGLDTSIYDDKGWLDLKYNPGGGEKSVRLDSYYLTNFDALMEEIARHKGWEWPRGGKAQPEGGAFPVEIEDEKGKG